MNFEADRAITIDGRSVVSDALSEGFNPAPDRAFVTNLWRQYTPNSRFLKDIP